MRAGNQCQRGFVLLEAVISVPMIVMLLASLGTAALWGMHHYLSIMADAELQQEVQFAFERVVEDMLEAREIRPLPGDKQGYEIIKTLPADAAGKEQEVHLVYWLNTIQGTHKLVCEDASAPMTGDHSLAAVTITEFSCTPEAGAAGLYVIRLTGKSEVTEHVYTLQTAVYLPMDQAKCRSGP